MMKTNISNGASAADRFIYFSYLTFVWKDELYTQVHVDITHPDTCSSSSRIQQNCTHEIQPKFGAGAQYFGFPARSPQQIKGDVNHVKRWDCSAKKKKSQVSPNGACSDRSFSDTTKDGSRPAHTKQILHLDQRKQLHHCCRRSIVLAAVVTKRGFRIASYAPPCAFAWLCFTTTRGVKKEAYQLLDHAGNKQMFAASLNFSLDRCKARK